jgi:hypothetical protein
MLVQQCHLDTLAAAVHSFVLSFCYQAGWSFLRCRDRSLSSLVACWNRHFTTVGAVMDHFVILAPSHPKGTTQPTFTTPREGSRQTPRMDLMYPRFFSSTSPSRTDCPGKDHNLTRMADFSVHNFKIFLVSFVFLRFISFVTGRRLDGSGWSISRRRGRQAGYYRSCLGKVGPVFGGFGVFLHSSTF